MENILEIRIKRPVADVFAFAIDPANTPSWIESITHEEIDTTEVAVGTTYTNDTGILIVSAFEQDRVFELTSDNGSYVVRYEFEAITDSESKLIYSEWMTDGTNIQNPLGMDTLKRLKSLLE